MSSETPEDPTTTLVDAAKGDPKAAEQLLPLVYDRLRAIAASYLKNERANHTLQPTALVHEAYMDLINIDRVEWTDRNHFLAMAARQMRRVLVDHAKAKSAKKRGGDLQQVSLGDDISAIRAPLDELLALDRAIEKLEKKFHRQGRVAELRVFAGMTVTEIAQFLDVSRRTATEDWALARAWLAGELRSEASS